jgi:hypothetical protein
VLNVVLGMIMRHAFLDGGYTGLAARYGRLRGT